MGERYIHVPFVGDGIPGMGTGVKQEPAQGSGEARQTQTTPGLSGDSQAMMPRCEGTRKARRCPVRERVGDPASEIVRSVSRRVAEYGDGARIAFQAFVGQRNHVA